MATSFARFLVLAALCLALSGTVTYAEVDASFCSALVKNLFTCPDIPTEDTVQLDKYTGKWYELGTNAVFAFGVFGQQGGQCVTANYTALGPINGTNTIKVVNDALKFTSIVRQAQTLGISLSSQAVSLGVKFLCQFLVGTQSLTDFLGLVPVGALQGALTSLRDTAAKAFPSAAAQISKQMDSLDQTLLGAAGAFPPTLLLSPISVSGLTHQLIADTNAAEELDAATKASILDKAQSILGSVARASEGAAEIFDALASIQISNLILNGRTLPEPYSAELTAGSIVNQTGNIQALGVALDGERDNILDSANAIKGLTWARAPKIAATATAIGYLAGQFGPIRNTIKETGLTAKLITLTASAIRTEKPQRSNQGVVGQAAQNASQPGALTVSFSMAPPPSSNNYKIIKLYGPAASGYDLALVFSCSSGITSAGLPQQGFFILSRTPTVPAAVITDALDFAKKQGVFLAGDNVFLTVSQDQSLCQRV